MTLADETLTEPPATVDEAGTAPGDRRFRPDIQGLRAVAVVIVLLYHAGLRGLGGGYVGVDVFFVISGFVITGVLLRERSLGWSTSLRVFYGRRSRRIIPAATLVIIVTVVASYAVLGVVGGNQAADDGKWTAVFLANFHFAALGTNYLTALRPPSPLLNFWSLGVEEQFYVVYPAIFFALLALPLRLSHRIRLGIGLVAIIVASYALSVVQTASSPTVAYFSPLTRAWELALGALIAVATPRLLAIPPAIGAVMSWAGMAAIAVSAVGFGATTAYPGSLAAVPVVGAALVIAGGTPAPAIGAEAILGTGPFQWVGKISYSLYLWHWPILVLAAESAGRNSLPFSQNIWWLVVAVAAAAITFWSVENPIRHASFGGRRWAPIAMGVVLVVTSVAVCTVELQVNDAHPRPTVSLLPSELNGKDLQRYFAANVASSNAEVEHLVAEARNIQTLPANLTPSLAAVPFSLATPPAPCWPSLGESSIPACVFGDPRGTRTMVIYGDSHAAMWFKALNLMAVIDHWKLVYLGKGDCPANDLPYDNPTGFGAPDSTFTPCNEWHRFAIDRIRALRPDLVVITEEFRGRPDGASYTHQQWTAGLERTIRELGVPAGEVAIVGNIPSLPESGPQCLARNPDRVQACSAPLVHYVAGYNQAEEKAAAAVRASYVDVIPWFCSSTCTAVIGRYEVYYDDYHVSEAYAQYLSAVLGQALHMGAPT